MSGIKQKNNEIDLINLILITWKSKVLIAAIIALTFIITNSIISNKKISKTKYLSSTEIKPITIFENYEYEEYNSYIENNMFLSKKSLSQDNFPNILIKAFEDNYSIEYINKSTLLSMFVEIIKESVYFEEAIKKFNYVKKENYPSNSEYEIAVTKLISSIKLKPPALDVKNGKVIKNSELSSWVIEHETEDVNNWLKVLEYVEKTVNLKVQNYLIDKFNKHNLIEQKLKQFEIEDIKTKISQAIKSYERGIAKEIKYLKEQSSIARKLDAPKDNGENFFPKRHDYMRGYVALEEEIKLLENRINFKNHIDEYPEFERKLEELLKNRETMRKIQIFNQTPVMKSDNFYAARILSNRTTFNTSNKSNRISKLKIFIFSTIFGLLIGTTIIFFRRALFARKN